MVRPIRTGPVDTIGATFALATVADSTPLTYSRSWLVAASYTPVTCVHVFSWAGAADVTRSAAPWVASGLAMANTQRPPSSGRYQRVKPAKVVPSWLTIACAPAFDVTFAHADTVRLTSVRTVLAVVTYPVPSRVIPVATAPAW